MSESKKWFLGIKNSDQEVLQAIFSDLKPSIKATLLAKGATSEQADDVFMDVLEAIFRKTRKETTAFFDDSKFEGYFTRANLLHWYKKCRRKKFTSGVTIEELTVPDSVDIEKELHQSEQAALYRRMFQQLGQECQKVLRLFIIEQKSHHEVAEVMDFSYQYAKKKKYRCNKQLVEMIKADPLFLELKD